jgi:hypothetical protein
VVRVAEAWLEEKKKCKILSAKCKKQNEKQLRIGRNPDKKPALLVF